VTRIQCANGRWYQTPEGAWVPSVTNILGCYPKGQGFDRWQAEQGGYVEAIAKRDAAGARGTLVHDAIAALIAGETVQLPEDTDPKAGKFIEGFINWWQEFQPKVIASEIFLVGDGYAGTCDLIFHLRGENWIIDYKTSSSVHTSHHLQTAAYATAAVMMDIVPVVHRRAILHLKTTTKKGWQAVESSHTPAEDHAAFLACKTIFHHEYGNEPIPFEADLPKSLVYALKETE